MKATLLPWPQANTQVRRVRGREREEAHVIASAQYFEGEAHIHQETQQSAPIPDAGLGVQIGRSERENPPGLSAAREVPAGVTNVSLYVSQLCIRSLAGGHVICSSAGCVPALAIVNNGCSECGCWCLFESVFSDQVYSVSQGVEQKQ